MGRGSRPWPSTLAAVASISPLSPAVALTTILPSCSLLQHGIGDCFKFLVCMGEAKSKPDPEGVQLALKTLGVERALFVGDTPDDIVAGNASAIKTIGVVAPAATDKPATKALLLKLGASQVFSEGLHEFAALL